MDELYFTIRDGHVVMSVPAEEEDAMYSVILEPDKARDIAFTLMDLADRIDPPAWRLDDDENE